jgi:formate dehydrogenase (coenzyme F420) beta subunit
MNFEKQKEEITGLCKQLFQELKVDLILGFSAGEPGMNATPLFMRTVEDINALVWDEFCTPNLAKYLLEKKKQRVALIAKPCDSRAVAMYMAEKQLQRDQVFIIGVECAGMKGKDGNPSPGCSTCTVRIPTVYDVLVKYPGELPEADLHSCPEVESDEFVDKLQSLEKEMEKCILCFSCRQACYGCYCETCFIDSGIPNWQPSELNTGRKMMFHLGRAMHLAGRCIECGACERACPSGVKINYLTKELSEFCEELYGYKAGMNPDETPAMSAFAQNDREIGFLGGEDK